MIILLNSYHYFLYHINRINSKNVLLHRYLKEKRSGWEFASVVSGMKDHVGISQYRGWIALSVGILHEVDVDPLPTIQYVHPSR